MFRIDLLSIIGSLNTVFTAIGICHTSYVDCLLARSGWNCSSILTPPYKSPMKKKRKKTKKIKKKMKRKKKKRKKKTTTTT